MLITSNKDGDGVFGLFKERVFEVSVGFRNREVGGGIVLTEILEPELVEVGHVVIHFAGELISESDEFEDLTADHASLERALPEHKPKEFMGLVVVFILRAGAADVSEGGIGGEYDEGVVDGAEVG